MPSLIPLWKIRGRHFQSVQTADFWAFPAAVAAYDLSKYRWQPIASCGGQVQQVMTSFI